MSIRLCTEAIEALADNMVALAASATSDISSFAISADAMGFSADLGNYDLCERQQPLTHCLAECTPEDLSRPDMLWYASTSIIRLVEMSRSGDLSSSPLLSDGGQQRLNYLVKLKNVLHLTATTGTGYTCGSHSAIMTPDRWVFMAVVLGLLLAVLGSTALHMVGGWNGHGSNGRFSPIEKLFASSNSNLDKAQVSSIADTIENSQNNVNGSMTVFDKLVDSFSLIKNVPYVFTERLGPNSDENRYRILDGLRVLSMVWVVLGHMLTASTLNGLSNPATLLPPTGVLTSVSAQVFMSARFAVETFFFISGFLVAASMLKRLSLGRAGPPNSAGTSSSIQIPSYTYAYGSLEQKASSGDRSGVQLIEPSLPPLRSFLCLFYLHRVLRIMPPYVFCLLLWWKIGVMMGTGPFWMKWNQFAYRCDRYWWTNVLFINNLFPYDSTEGDQCFYVTWYLANDMQFYIVAPLFIWVYLHSRRTGFALTALAVAASIGCGYLWSLEHDASAHSFDGMNVGIYSRSFYTKPQFRFPAYGIGLLSGMLRHWWTDVCPSYVVPEPAARIALWVSSLVLGGITFFAGLSAYQNRPCSYIEYTSDVCGSGWSAQHLALYNSLTQPLWALALATLTLLSSSGQGRYISRFLSHRLWSAPSRLCFAIYLVHVTIINLYVLSQTTKLRYSHLDFAVSFAAIVFLSFAAGLLIVVFIESPACRLSKHLETSLSAFFSNADAPKHDEIRQERSINSRAQSLGEQEHELMPITTRS